LITTQRGPSAAIVLHLAERLHTGEAGAHEERVVQPGHVLGRPAVLVGPLGPQHLAVGDVADQGVPEPVLDLARHPRGGRPAQELARLQAVQARHQLPTVAAADLGQRPQPADLAEHGGVVEHRLVGGGQGVQARGDQGLD
jgi:hypothetical protein